MENLHLYRACNSYRLSTSQIYEQLFNLQVKFKKNIFINHSIRLVSCKSIANILNSFIAYTSIMFHLVSYPHYKS